MTAPDTAEVLRRAADIIEERGWTRGALRRDGRFCVFGAILEATPTDHDGRPEREAAKRLADSLGLSGRAWQAIARWNDEQKSRRPVIAALREAAGETEE